MRKIADSSEDAVQRLVQRLRRGEVAPERLLDDDPRAPGAAGFAEPSTTVGNRLGGMAR